MKVISGAEHSLAACLVSIQRQKNLFIYNLKNDFTNQTVYDMLESTDKTIWIATENGLWNFNPVTTTFRHYTTADGLPNDTALLLN